MITNKDIRVENGFLIINGDKYPLDGQSPEAIMQIVENNSDTTPTENSAAPVTSGAVYTALAGKEDTLTFDNAPTARSDNPVKSGGIFDALNKKISLLENKETTTGNSITLDTALSPDKDYLVSVHAPTSTDGRRMKFSIINYIGTTINEIYIGSSDIVLSIAAGGILTITSTDLRYGLVVSLIKLS